MAPLSTQILKSKLQKKEREREKEGERKEKESRNVYAECEAGVGEGRCKHWRTGMGGHLVILLRCPLCLLHSHDYFTKHMQVKDVQEYALLNTLQSR